MIFIYKKGTNEFVGLATQVFDNGTMREATIEELYPDEDHSKLGSLVVKDHIKYSLAPDEWMFKLDENGTPVDIVRKPQPPTITLKTNAPDTDEDGLPELPADGASKAAITISIKNPNGRLHKETTNLLISTTGGALSERRISTDTGKAKVHLTSSMETVTATVTVTAEDLEPASMTFEFMPS